jgi:hypothetical protein
VNPLGRRNCAVVAKVLKVLLSAVCNSNIPSTMVHCKVFFRRPPTRRQERAVLNKQRYKPDGRAVPVHQPSRKCHDERACHMEVWQCLTLASFRRKHFIAGACRLKHQAIASHSTPKRNGCDRPHRQQLGKFMHSPQPMASPAVARLIGGWPLASSYSILEQRRVQVSETDGYSVLRLDR